MDYYTLYNGYKIPIIGYGTYPQKKTLEKNIENAEKNGYRLIDTADNYFNEEYVGKGLKRIKVDNLVIVSKLSKPYKSMKVEECFNASKKALDGKLNIYLLHWPYPFLWRRMWRQMEELYLQGKCDAIGVCNFEKKHLLKLLRKCRVKPMIDQFECHPDFQQRETIEFCKNHDIQVMSYSPLARNNGKLMKNIRIQAIAQKYQKTVGQVILKWNICKGLLPIPASSKLEHIIENIDIFDFNLTAEEVEIIDSLDANNRVRFDPDNRFSLKDKVLFFFCWILKR